MGRTVLFMCVSGPPGQLFHVKVPPLLTTDWRVVVWPAEDGAVSPDDLVRMAPGFDAIVSGAWEAHFVDILYRVLAAATNCALYQIPFTGHDHVRWAQLPGHITVSNVFGMDPGIAEYVLAAVLGWTSQLWVESASMRRTGLLSLPFRGGQRAPRAEAGGRTLGLVGFGHIAFEIAKRAAGIGMRVVAVRRSQQDPPPGVDWVRPVRGGLDDLLRESDFVVVACDLNASTKGLIGERELRLMRKEAVLINVARGAVVDEAALYTALKEQRIGGAVIDVWWRYPASPQENKDGVKPSQFPFEELSNVVMTPHCSGWTDGFAHRRQKVIAENLDRVARGSELLNVIGGGKKAGAAPKRAAL